MYLGFSFRHWLSPSAWVLTWKEMKIVACPSIRSTASASLRTRTVLSTQSTAWHGPWSCGKNKLSRKHEGNHDTWISFGGTAQWQTRIPLTSCMISCMLYDLLYTNTLQSFGVKLQVASSPVQWVAAHVPKPAHDQTRCPWRLQRPNAAVLCGRVWTQARMRLKWTWVAEMIWEELDVEHIFFLGEGMSRV